MSAHPCRYSDLNQSASGQIVSGPSGSGVGIITTLLMCVATVVVVIKAVSEALVLVVVVAAALTAVVRFGLWAVGFCTRGHVDRFFLFFVALLKKPTASVFRAGLLWLCCHLFLFSMLIS